jgi:hypothetical protein
MAMEQVTRLNSRRPVQAAGSSATAKGIPDKACNPSIILSPKGSRISHQQHSQAGGQPLEE